MYKTLRRILSAPRGILRWLIDGDPHGMRTTVSGMVGSTEQ